MMSRPLPAWPSLVLLLWLVGATSAQTLAPDTEVLATYPWADTANTLPPDWEPSHRELVGPATATGGRILKVSNPGPDLVTVAVLTISKPPVTSDYFALRCQVSYEGVSGDGYLEMWSTFADGSRIFERTLNHNPGNPANVLNGTSAWRPLLLPFDHPEMHAAGARPEKLMVNVILPGRGIVYLTEMQLIQVPPVPLSADTNTPTAVDSAAVGKSGQGRPGFAATLRGPTPNEEMIGRYRWEEAAKPVSPETMILPQTVDAPPHMGGTVLKITHPGGPPSQVNLLTIPKPPITGSVYLLRGEVRYHDVSEAGYLEMWNDFPGGGSYLSRTQGELPGEPMAKLVGDSDWRPFVLPFDAKGTKVSPDQLRVDLVLPGRGTVYLSELQLFQVRTSPAASVTGRRGATGMQLPAAYVFVGGLMTSAMIFLGVLARHQRYRAFVLAGAWALTGLAVVLVLGAVWEVWKSRMPLSESVIRLVPGVFVCGMFAGCAAAYRRCYRHAEWRRMTALDA